MFIGNGGAGKTTAMRTLVGLPFRKAYVSTIVGDADGQVELHAGNISEWKLASNRPGENLLATDLKNMLKGVEITKAVQVSNGGRASNSDSIDTLLTFGPPQQSKINIPSDFVEEAISTKGKLLKKPTQNRLRGYFANLARRMKQPVNNQVIRRTFALWDFGGQEVFHTVHHLFMTSNGVYILVMNLQKWLGGWETQANLLKFWLESVFLNTNAAPVVIVGTHCELLDAVSLSGISKVVEGLPEIRDTNIVQNVQDRLVFFPVENSKPRKYKSAFLNLKEAIETAANESLGEVSSKEIPLAWVFFMDYLIQDKSDYLRKGEIQQKAFRLGITKETVEEIVHFYHETGTIIHLGSLKSTVQDVLDDIVLLNPHWLLKALAAFVYDVNIHRSKAFDLPEHATQIREYEDNAILPQSLLFHFWKKYSEKERKFLMALNEDLLLMSQYIFKLPGASQSLPEKYFLVPGMLRKHSAAGLSTVPDVADRLSLLMKFDGPTPKGLFERIICLFLSKSSGIEGSTHPSLFVNAAHFLFRDANVYLLAKPKMSAYQIVIHKYHKRWIRNICVFASEIISTMTEKFFKRQIEAYVLLQGQGDEDLVAKETFVRKALGAKESMVRDFTEERVVPIKPFLPFFPSSSLNDSRRSVTKTWDCFLAHEWGTEQEGFLNHQLVMEIGKRLEGTGLSVWLDNNNLEENVSGDIIEGLGCSRKIIVFITTRYFERTNDINTNAHKEFIHATKKGIQFLIPVVLDEAALNPRTWFKTVVGYHLGDAKYIDFSTEQKRAENFEQLVGLIQKKGGLQAKDFDFSSSKKAPTDSLI